MIRFHMPKGALPKEERIACLEDQFAEFLKSDALKELLSALETDIEGLSRDYSGRTKLSGGVMETQDMKTMPELEALRHRLYPLLKDLGFIDINMPLETDHTRILILGGAMGACFDRTAYSAEFVTKKTISVDALTCYRPINPVERIKAKRESMADTEFGIMTEASGLVYDLDSFRWKDDFSGDRNLNSISCCRTYEGKRDRDYRVFAAPSSQPRLKRADTGDCLCFYLEQTDPGKGDSLLAVTSNRYCNRQFLQMAYEMIRMGCRADLDIIGCRRDETIDSVDSYDPIQYLQDLIGIIDWIGKFRELREKG